MDSNATSSSKTRKPEFIALDMGMLSSTHSLPEDLDHNIVFELREWVKKEKKVFHSQGLGKSNLISIFKIPEKLLIANVDAFVPRLVSIGPYHHCRIKLEDMKRYKLKCMYNFAEEYPFVINNIIDALVQDELKIRACYERHSNNLDIKDFVKMIMLDAIFIFELILKESKADYDKKIFDNWMLVEILHDMLLLENQVPWFVLSLIEHRRTYSPMDYFLKSLITYFKVMGITCPPEVILSQAENSNFVEMLGRSLLPKPKRRKPERQEQLELPRTATQLHDVGVKFIKGDDSKALLDIDFRRGDLIVPQLTVNEWTETFFRNQIAFELRGKHQNDKFVTSYVIFIDSLINSSSDVDLLLECGIINNLLKDSQKVADLFNNLDKEHFLDNNQFYYAKLCEELNDHSRNTWYQWITKLNKWKRMLGSDNYFGNPWTTVSVIAAIILLMLTIIQTYCALFPRPSPKS